MPEAALRDLSAVLETAPRDTVPVLPALRPVLPGGGLRPGSVVGLGGLGAASLGLALVAGVSRHGGADGTGGWCGVVGVPDFGVAAAAGMGWPPPDGCSSSTIRVTAGRTWSPPSRRPST